MGEPVSVPELPVYPTEGDLPAVDATSRVFAVVTDYAGSGVAHVAINDGTTLQYKSLPELISSALERRMQGLRFPFYECEFMNRSSSSNFDPWTYTAINSGTMNQPSISTAGHPGVIRVQCSATANSGARWGVDGKALRIAGGEFFSCIYYCSAVSTITTRLGFHDCVNVTDATNGCYFEIAPTGIAVGKNASASSRNATGTIYTLVPGNWYTFVIEVNNAATSVQYTILDDAGAVLDTAAQAATIPTAADTGSGIVTTSTNGAAINLLEIDYMAMGWTKALTRF